MIRRLIAVVLALLPMACTGGAKPAAPSPDASAAAAPDPAALEREALASIEALEARRSLGGDALFAFARSESPRVRARALRALGRLQPGTVPDVLRAAFADPDTAVRREAAFAAALFGTAWIPLGEGEARKLEAILLEAEGKERVGLVRPMILRALGDLGTTGSRKRLVEKLASDDASDVEHAAIALGVAAKRGAALADETLAALLPLLEPSRSPRVRYAGAYALAFSKNPKSRGVLGKCLGDPDADVRAVCARGLGDVAETADVKLLTKALSDEEGRVAAEAARALAKTASRCKTRSCPALPALHGLAPRISLLAGGKPAQGGPPLLALAQQGVPAAGVDLLSSLRKGLAANAKKVEGQPKKDLATLDCRFAAAIDRAKGTFVESKGCGFDLIGDPQRLSLGLRELAMAPPKDPKKRLAEVSPYLSNESPLVRSAALEALREVKLPAATALVRPLVDDPDELLAVNAVSVLGAHGDKESLPKIRAFAERVKKRPDLADGVSDALVALAGKEAEAELSAWLAYDDTHPRHVAAAALAKLTGKPVEAPLLDRAAPLPAPSKLPKELTFQTARGDIRVRLFPDDSPRTAANLGALANKGYFKNLTFHRVVPDFVAQGGDPRGDGEGGPGYAIPCELSPQRYERGVLGMALSGKDTGGSQFFFTTSRQPHLDGRYTAFGEVVSGMDAVDALLEGDALIDVLP